MGQRDRVGARKPGGGGPGQGAEAAAQPGLQRRVRSAAVLGRGLRWSPFSGAETKRGRSAGGQRVSGRWSRRPALPKDWRFWIVDMRH